MKFENIKVYPSLEKYIAQIFVLQTSGKLPEDDLKLITPNGRPKIVIPFKNSMVASFNGKEYKSKEHKITLIGISDLPSFVDIDKNEPFGNITVEFSPLGAYRFFNIRLDEIKNTICDFEDIGGTMIALLEQNIQYAGSIAGKVKLVQDFLASLFPKRPDDPIFEFCIHRIHLSKGRISIKELERATGYTARWLNTKFNDRIGTSAKNLCSIIRFQQYYQALNSNKDLLFFEKAFYDYYYDQSHFIKDFKRFTGCIPSRLIACENDYDRVFYRG